MMDTPLAAAIVLALTTIALFILHEAKRREAKRLQADLDETRTKRAVEIRTAKSKALLEGYKLCQGDAYVAVVKAENRGTSAIEALRELIPPAVLDQAQERLTWIKV